MPVGSRRIVCRLHLSIRSCRICLPTLPSKSTLSGKHDGGAAAGLERPVDVLQEAELLVGRRVGEVRPAWQAAALLGAEGRIGEDQRGLRQRLRLPAESVSP